MPLDVGVLRIDAQLGRAWVGSERLSLRPLDMRVLTCLAMKAGRVISRRSLAHMLWGPGATVDPRTVDTCVTRIRRALNGSGDAIVTVRRVGYRLDPERLSA